MLNLPPTLIKPTDLYIVTISKVFYGVMIFGTMMQIHGNFSFIAQSVF